MRATRLIGLVGLVATVFVSSCRSDRELALIDVHNVESNVVEAGGKLRIRGEGFPLGNRATLLLRGTLSRPGKDPRNLRQTLRADVSSEQIIEAPISQEWIDEIGGRGTFLGSVTIYFRAAIGELTLRADLPVQVDFVPSTRARFEDAVEHEKNTQDLTNALAIQIEDDPNSASGLQVTQVRADGLAARHGLRVGDRIDMINRVRLLMYTDFVAPTRSSELNMHIVRSDAPYEKDIVVPLNAGAFVRFPNAQVRTWVAGIIGGLLGVFSPLLIWLFGDLRPKYSLSKEPSRTSGTTSSLSKLIYLALSLALVFFLRRYSLLGLSAGVSILFVLSSIPWLRRDARLLWRFGGVVTPLALMNVAAASLGVQTPDGTSSLSASADLRALNFLRDPILFAWFYLWLATLPRRLLHERKYRQHLRLLGNALLMILGTFVWIRPWTIELYDAPVATLLLTLLEALILWSFVEIIPQLWNRKFRLLIFCAITLCANLWLLPKYRESVDQLSPIFLLAILAGLLAQWIWIRIPKKPPPPLVFADAVPDGDRL